ncbi:MAG: FecR domain-containing protein [Desulfatibacillaceae bacterium]
MNKTAKCIGTGIAALILFVALLPATGNAANPIGRVTKIEGRATIERDQRLSDARVGVRLYQKDIVRTGPGGRLRIRLADNSIVSVDQNSHLDLAEYEFEPKKKTRKAFFSMLTGKIRVFANSLAGYKKRSFDVRTPTAICGVRGTVFMVWVQSDTITVVACYDSQVQVQNVMDPSQYLLLSEGLKTQIMAGQAPEQPVLMTEEELEEFRQGEFSVIGATTEAATTQAATTQADTTEAATTEADTTEAATTRPTTTTSPTTTTTSTTTTTTSTTTTSTTSTTTIPKQLPGPPGFRRR